MGDKTGSSAKPNAAQPALGKYLYSVLTANQKKMIVAVLHQINPISSQNASPVLTEVQFNQYLETYRLDPYQVNRLQNQFISKKIFFSRNGWAKQAVLLNAIVERKYPMNWTGIPDEMTHRVIENASYLVHGDILPGTPFILGNPYTYSRELLRIEKDSPHTVKVTRRAKFLAAQGKSELEIAKSIHRQINRLPVTDHDSFPVGHLIGPGTMLHRKNGCCRHKAALLVIALQEAGIKATYVRGTYAKLKHAWVDAELGGENYYLDPSLGHFYKRPEKPRIKGILHELDNARNVVWRPRI